MEAEVGSNPSYIWRSLCWSRQLRDPSLRWCVANGSSIYLFQDAWIPGLHTGCITSRIASGLMVSRFIKDLNTWDDELINMAFLPHEADAILKTPVYSWAKSDSRYWIHEKKGHYFVKRGTRATGELCTMVH